MNLVLQDLRNIGIAAHVDAGKTTATSCILRYTNATHKLGSVDEGTADTDYLPEEQQRGITIQSAVVSAKWRLLSTTYPLNIIDTPGHVDFKIEVARSLRVLDGAIILLDARKGVQAQTRSVYRQADKHKVPRVCFVNKMDVVGADFANVVAQIKDRLKGNPAVLQLPMGAEDKFKGVVDLLDRKAYLWAADDAEGINFQVTEVPAEMREAVEAARATLVEQALDFDDALMTRFLEGEEEAVSNDVPALKRALRKGTIELKVVPVLCGSAWKRKGVQPLLDAAVAYLPSPLDIPAIKGKLPNGEVAERRCDPKEPLSALMFKIIEDDERGGERFFVRVYSGVLRAGTKVLVLNSHGKEQQESIGRILKIQADDETSVSELWPGELGALSGLKHTATGDTLCAVDHPIILESVDTFDPVIAQSIELVDADGKPKSTGKEEFIRALDKLRRQDPSFNFYSDDDSKQIIIEGLGELHLDVKVDFLKRKKIFVKVGDPAVKYRWTIQKGVEITYTHKKQTGGSGQYAKMTFCLEKIEGEEFEFVNKITGGAIDKEYIPAIEKGMRDVLEHEGFPIQGVKVTLIDGDTHSVDSSAMAFEIAARGALREAFDKAGLELLEPWGLLEATVDEGDYVGDVIGSINSRRGRIIGQEQVGDSTVVRGELPISRSFRFVEQLRSLTKGTGEFTLEPLKYEAAPQSVETEVLAMLAAKKAAKA
jgi:elongation factor G